MSKLHQNGIHGTVLYGFSSYLGNRYQFVQNEKSEHDKIPITVGYPRKHMYVKICLTCLTRVESFPINECQFLNEHVSEMTPWNLHTSITYTHDLANFQSGCHIFLYHHSYIHSDNQNLNH